MAPDAQLVIDWSRPPRPRPQASLEAYAPDLALAAARRAREESRRRPRPQPRAPRQLALEEGGEAHAREVVEFDLKASSRLKSIYIAEAGPARPAHRPDEEIRDALVRACESGATREDAVLAAARECAVPAASLSLVDALLEDLVLEGALAAYGDVLFARRRGGRKLVALDVGEDDLVDLLSKGHRVLELK